MGFFNVNSGSRRAFLALLLYLLPLASAVALPRGFSFPKPRQADGNHWVATWTAAPFGQEEDNLPPTNYTQNSVIFKNATLRQTLHMSIGGERLRLQISNAFGDSELPISAASIALPDGGEPGVGQIVPSTLKPLTFNNGSESVTIPQGQVIYTDPVDFEFNPQSMISVTLYSEEGQTGSVVTGHALSKTNSWMAKGNQVNEASVDQAYTEHWYFLSAVEAWAPASTAAFVLLGDSITDGTASDVDSNNRWGDYLLTRMINAGITELSVCNQAISGNTVKSTVEGSAGPPLVDRYQRDLLGVAGVKYAIIFEGVNDIGLSANDNATQDTTRTGVEDGYDQVVADASAAGITMFGATITPFGGSGYDSPAHRRTWRQLNKYTAEENAPGYQGIVDFNAAIADPSDPTQMDPAYDSGDHLHPGPPGYEAMAEAFPLELLSGANKTTKKSRSMPRDGNRWLLTV